MGTDRADEHGWLKTECELLENELAQLEAQPREREALRQRLISCQQSLNNRSADLAFHEAYQRSRPAAIVPTWHPITGNSRYGLALFVLRMIARLKQRCLADRLGANQSTIARWEAQSRCVLASAPTSTINAMQKNKSPSYRLNRVNDWADECGYRPITCFVRKAPESADAIVTQIGVEMTAIKYAYPDSPKRRFELFLGRFRKLARADSISCYALSWDEKWLEVCGSDCIDDFSGFIPRRVNKNSLPYRHLSDPEPGFIENVIGDVTDDEEEHFVRAQHIGASVYIPMVFDDRNVIIFLNYRASRPAVAPRPLERLAEIKNILTFALGSEYFKRPAKSSQTGRAPSYWHRTIRGELRQLASYLGVPGVSIRLYLKTRFGYEPAAGYPLVPVEGNEHALTEGSQSDEDDERRPLRFTLHAGDQEVGLLEVELSRESPDAVVDRAHVATFAEHLAQCCTKEYRDRAMAAHGV